MTGVRAVASGRGPSAPADARTDLLTIACLVSITGVTAIAGASAWWLAPIYAHALAELCAWSLSELARHHTPLLAFAPAVMLAVVGLRLAHRLAQQARSTRAFLIQLGPVLPPSERVTRAREHLDIAATVSVRDQVVPLAFCHGLIRPAICVTTGLLDLLDDDELEAVLAHEAHHAMRRDPARLWLAGGASAAVAFVPGAMAWFRNLRVWTELAADQAASLGGRSVALAAAVVSLSGWYHQAGQADLGLPETLAGVIRLPERRSASRSMALERVQALLGDGPPVPETTGSMRLGLVLGLTAVLALNALALDAGKQVNLHLVHEPCETIATAPH